MVDEGHRLKNSEASPQAVRCCWPLCAHSIGNCTHPCSYLPLARQARLFQALRGLRVRHRLLLTGTPLQVGVGGASDLGCLFPCWILMRAPSMRLIRLHTTSPTYHCLSVPCYAVLWSAERPERAVHAAALPGAGALCLPRWVPPSLHPSC